MAFPVAITPAKRKKMLLERVVTPNKKRLFPQLYCTDEIDELRKLVIKESLRTREDEDGNIIYENYHFKPAFASLESDVNYDKMQKQGQILARLRKKNEKLPEEYFSREITELMKLKICKQCGIEFREIDNFNKTCVYHPGEVRRTALGGYEISCCKDDPSKCIKGSYSGCTPCDHKTFSRKWASPQDDERIPCYFIDNKNIKVPASSILNKVEYEEDYLASYYVVKRLL